MWPRASLGVVLREGGSAGSDRAAQPVKILHNTYYKHILLLLVGSWNANLLFERAGNS